SHFKSAGLRKSIQLQARRGDGEAGKRALRSVVRTILVGLARRRLRREWVLKCVTPRKVQGLGWFQSLPSHTGLYISPRLRRKAGTSRSACSKLRAIASRMLSSARTSGDVELPTVCIPANDEPEDRVDATGSWCDSITIAGGSGTESKSSE